MRNMSDPTTVFSDSYFSFSVSGLVNKLEMCFPSCMKEHDLLLSITDCNNFDNRS